MLLPFDIKNKIFPIKCIITLQFALQFELLSLNFVATP